MGINYKELHEKIEDGFELSSPEEKLQILNVRYDNTYETLRLEQCSEDKLDEICNLLNLNLNLKNFDEEEEEDEEPTEE